jgi:hypothetical protein
MPRTDRSIFQASVSARANPAPIPDGSARSFRIIDVFGNNLACTDSDIELPVRQDGAAHLWMSSIAQSGFSALLANIALRLEPAPRSGWPTERAIGEIRRALWPHRAIMKVYEISWGIKSNEMVMGNYKEARPTARNFKS